MPNILQPSLSNTPTSKVVAENATVTPYATDLLQRGQAFTTAETPVYEGALTTGPSQYQNQAWQGLANLTIPQNLTAAGNQLGNISQQQQNLSYDPTKFTAGTFGAAEAQKYMNPYIQTALDPQLEYMRRQTAINQQADMAKLAQAGAFGGSRQAILQGQNQEALARQQALTAGQGYQQAFTQAQAQYNADQAREMEAQKASEQSKQYGAGYRQTGLSNAANTEQARAQAGASEAQYGLANLNALSTAGATQHEQEQAALDAQYKDWLRQTEYPAKQLEQMKGLITGLAPVTPETKTTYGQKEKAASTAAGLLGAAAGALGIKTMADLEAKAKALGVPVEKFKNMLGIGSEAAKKESDSNYGKIGDTKGETAGTDTPEGTHRDAEGNLVDDETGARIGYVTPEGEGMVDDPGFNPGDDMFDPSVESFGEGEYAKGGLIDLLHKMRSYK
jgi:hypothetical protein